MDEDEVLRLVECALNDDAAAVRDGLARGMPPNIYLDGPTLLMLLSQRGQTQMLKVFLEGGAYVNSCGDHGFTALMTAALHGRGEAVDVLLDHGADPNQRDEKGSSALRCAIDNQHHDVIARLCRRGADPQQADKNGITDALWALDAGVRLPPPPAPAPSRPPLDLKPLPWSPIGLDPFKKSATLSDALALWEASGRLMSLNTAATTAALNWSVPGAAIAKGSGPTTIDERTIDELATLRDRFLAWSEMADPLVGWLHPPLGQAAECSRLAGFILNGVLDDPKRAAAKYAEAAADFTRAGNADEAAKANEQAQALAAPGGKLEQQIGAARAKEKQLLPGTTAKATAQIDLGELLLRARNPKEAIEVLLAADATLKQAGYATPPSILGRLGDLAVGSVSDAMQRAAGFISVRTLFRRLYEALAKAHGPIDPHNPGNPALVSFYEGLIKIHGLFTLAPKNDAS